ncbi:MAG: DUF4097 family beta strand repeat-containing protein, partial [Opitutales bacterium]
LAAALLLALGVTAPRAHAADETTTTTIKFSDPTKPGTLKVIVKMGDIAITGADTPEVSVRSSLKTKDPAPRADGMRVLSESATFSLTEKDNVVTLDTGTDFWAGAAGDAGFKISVPRNTNVVVRNGFGGEVKVGNLAGDIEIKSLNGEIVLKDISGGALVETMNGEIKADLSALHEGKPLSFTSMNGEINIRVPADAKASVRLRSQNGAILTDFDEKALVTKAEALPGGRRAGRITINSLDDSEIKVAMREAVQAGVMAAREAAEAMREAAQAAKEAAEESRESNATSGSNAPLPPMPPMPPVPPMTGGKLVSGVLNGGGGPEIYAAAMNGDVTLRKAK